MVGLAACAALLLVSRWALEQWNPHGAASAHTATNGPLLLQGGSAFEALETTPGEERRRATFADGSWIEVSGGAHVRALGSNRSRMVSLLERGRATFEVVPGGPRQWTVEAGALSVEVLGTRFSVERTRDEVRVEVERGSVLVRSAGIENGVMRLDAGGSLAVRPPAPPPLEQGVEPDRVEPDPIELGAPSAVALDDLDPEPNHPDRIGSGRGGVAPDVEELLQRADAARRAGNRSLAITELEALLTRFPADPRTPAARFQLARLHQEAGHVDSARAALARSAHERGPLAEDAYRRWIELEQSVGASDTARALAIEYLQRYPQGRHRTFMESLSKP